MNAPQHLEVSPDEDIPLERRIANADEILIIESLDHKDRAGAETRLRKIEAELSEIYGKSIPVELHYASEDNEGVFANRNNALVLFNADKPDGFLLENLPFSLPATRRLAEHLKAESPTAEYLVLCNIGDSYSGSLKPGKPLRMALEKILEALDRPDDGFLNHLVGDFRNLMKKETVVDYLDHQIGPIRHQVGAEKDAAFIKELSERFMDGNNQTRTERTFLIISDRLDGLQGKFDVIRQGADLSTIDYSRYSAVFVDNNYSFKNGSSKLGTGISVLKQLSSQGLRIPIIYQTAHSLDELSESDLEQLRAFPDVVLMPKNRAFKICTSQQAKKELAVSELLQVDPLLNQYSVRAHAVDVTFDENVTLLSTEATRSKANPKYLGGEFGIENETYTHRMAVLAAFHARMKHELPNSTFSSTVAYLRPWETIEQRLHQSEATMPDVQELYRELHAKHAARSPTTIIHQDPKWDNWFAGYILGDFADSGPGREEKDIARALLDKETDFQRIRDSQWVNEKIEDYIAVRRMTEPEYEVPGNFQDDVKELIFLESVRLAGFLSQTKGHENTVQGLLSVAQQYQSLLSASYKTIPSIGDSAP